MLGVGHRHITERNSGGGLGTAEALGGGLQYGSVFTSQAWKAAARLPVGTGRGQTGMAPVPGFFPSLGL